MPCGALAAMPSSQFLILWTCKDYTNTATRCSTMTNWAYKINDQCFTSGDARPRQRSELRFYLPLRSKMRLNFSRTSHWGSMTSRTKKPTNNHLKPTYFLRCIKSENLPHKWTSDLVTETDCVNYGWLHWTGIKIPVCIWESMKVIAGHTGFDVSDRV